MDWATLYKGVKVSIDARHKLCAKLSVRSDDAQHLWIGSHFHSSPRRPASNPAHIAEVTLAATSGAHPPGAARLESVRPPSFKPRPPLSQLPTVPVAAGTAPGAPWPRWSGPRNGAGLPHGRGVLAFESGGRYDGACVNGRLQGPVVERRPDGARAEGGFADGLPHGPWLVTRADGTRLEERFVHGALESQRVRPPRPLPTDPATRP
jgi:hypothetical protein